MTFLSLLIVRVDSLQLVAGIALSLAITLISYKLRAVSLSGAIGMAAIGTIVFGLGGIVFAVPLIFFFVSSSILTAVKTAGKQTALMVSQKTGPRDIYQVMANGGIGAIAVIIYFISGDIIWFFPYLASLCEATSDTWGTEIGTLHPDSPVSIMTFKRVEPGQSGGITVLETLGAIAGTLFTMLVAWSVSPLLRDLSPVDARAWLAATNCGLVGSFLDSVCGASIQAQYRCQDCGQLVERKSHCNLPATHVRGIKFVGNDLVNFASTSFAAIMAAIILLLKI